MSYDVQAGNVWENYTSNLRPFFEEFGVDIPSMHEQLGQMVAARIDAALLQIVATPVALLNEFNPSNGWGSWTGALGFPMRIRDGARTAPEETVEVSW